MNPVWSAAPMEAWLWTLLAVAVVSAVSLIGAVVTTRHLRRHSILLFLVAVAAGSLVGDSIFHLLPEAVEERGDFSLGISLAVVLGFLAFFFLEIIFRQRHTHGEEALGTGHDHHAPPAPLVRQVPAGPHPVVHRHAAAKSQVAPSASAPSSARAGVLPTSASAPASTPPSAHAHPEEASPRNETPVATYGYMNLAGDALHNFLDGIIIAASFLVSVPVGIATSIAVILHEVPQELADFAVLLRAGMRRGQALLWNFATALCAVMGAALVFLIPGATETVGVWAMPVIAGAFLYIAAADLVPELHHHTGDRHVWVIAAGVLLGIAAMLALTFIEAPHAHSH